MNDENGKYSGPWGNVREFFSRPRVRNFLVAARDPVVTFVVVFASTTAFAQPFYVPSGSMEPTLQIGDALIAAKYPYGYSRFSIPFMQGQPGSTHRFLEKVPARGDIVVFRLPRDTHQTYVKRVVGLPGDRIQMIDGRLWINGHMLPIRRDGSGAVEMEDGSSQLVARYIETLPNGREHPIFKWRATDRDNTDVYVVPKDHLFMMGDDRDNSLDSRWAPDDPLEPGVGYVPMSDLIGKAEFVVGSYDFLNAHAIWTWFGQFRVSRFFSGIS